MAVVAMIMLGLALGGDSDDGGTVVRVELNDRGEADVAKVVEALGEATGLRLERRPRGGTLRLPMTGLGGPLSRSVLTQAVGPGVVLSVEGQALTLKIPSDRLGPASRDDWERRLRGLVERIGREEKRRERYGMHARNSYRPNDPARPTVCLIHGLNSTSGVFQHMLGPIEGAGYGVVVYDFPYNRDLDESAEAFRRDWAAFRERTGDRRPWAIVAHSMGGLLARGYVEDDPSYRGDVASLTLIAPVNRGSNLSKVQTIHQAIQGLKTVNGTAGGEALAKLGDGLGAAAEDMAPGSAFLTALNAKQRRPGVPYHTLAGSGGFLAPSARGRIEAQLGLAGKSGMIGGLARLALGDVAAQLDEVTAGTGDGCVSVAATRLEGVADHVVIPANHLELIRAPLLYPDPGPVASMPYILRWLRQDLPAAAPGAGGVPRGTGRQGLGPGGDDR